MILRPLSIDRLREQFAAAEPFPHVCIDDFLEPDFAEQVADAYPSFEESNACGKRFETVNEHRKVQVTDPGRFPPAIRRLHDELHSSEFLAQLSTITGIPDLLSDPRMLGGGIHQTATGGRLDVHVDFNYLPDVRQFRRLNLLLYLNREWQGSWGGELELWDQDVQTCHQTFAPKLGRCVIFATSNHSFHGARKVTCPRDITRNSFALYYYTYQPPPDFDDDFHGTVFRARPGEVLKGRVLMPAERLAQRIRYRARNLIGGMTDLFGASRPDGEGPAEPRATARSEDPQPPSKHKQRGAPAQDGLA